MSREKVSHISLVLFKSIHNTVWMLLSHLALVHEGRGEGMHVLKQILLLLILKKKIINNYSSFSNILLSLQC